MFGNIKKLLEEKKKERFLQKSIAEYNEYVNLDEDRHRQSELQAAFANAFANEQEMRDVFSEIYASMCCEDFSECSRLFRDYIYKIRDGYSRQYALYVNTHSHEYEYKFEYNEYSAIHDELFLSDYYRNCKDTNVALKDLNLYVSKETWRINDPVFEKAYSNEFLQICTNKDYRDKALKFYAEDNVWRKYYALESAFSSTIPPRIELEELSERLNRMDDNAKRKADNRYYPRFWKYLAHIAASKLVINVSDEYKDVVALTILLGLGCEDFIYVDNAVEYVESTLSFLELSVPAKDVEKLCYLAAERCKKEVEMYIDLRRQCWSPVWSSVEEMVKLVTEFGIIE